MIYTSRFPFPKIEKSKFVIRRIYNLHAPEPFFLLAGGHGQNELPGVAK
jgi:hypothetical protein